jgi:hypothetical protein
MYPHLFCDDCLINRVKELINTEATGTAKPEQAFRGIQGKAL